MFDIFTAVLWNYLARTHWLQQYLIRSLELVSQILLAHCKVINSPSVSSITTCTYREPRKYQKPSGTQAQICLLLLMRQCFAKVNHVISFTRMPLPNFLIWYMTSYGCVPRSLLTLDNMFSQYRFVCRDTILHIPFVWRILFLISFRNYTNFSAAWILFSLIFL